MPSRSRAPLVLALLARAESRPLPLAPLIFRLASLPSPPSLRTSRRQRAVVVSHPLARPGSQLQTRAATGHAGRSPRQRRCPGMGADPAAPRGRRARRARRSESERASVFVRYAFQSLVSRGPVGAAPAAPGGPSRPQPQARPASLLLRPGVQAHIGPTTRRPPSGRAAPASLRGRSAGERRCRRPPPRGRVCTAQQPPAALSLSLSLSLS